MARSMVVRGLVLSALFGFTALAARSSAQDKKDLPPAKDILAKYLEAVGGKDAILKYESSKAKGKFEMPSAGLKGELEVFAAKPNKMLVKVKIEELGEILQGYDGKVAWSINPIQGPQVMEGKMAEDIADKALFHGEVTEAERFKTMETLGVEKYNDQECYKVKLVKKNGNESIRYYNQKTGLLAGNTGTQETPMGALEVKTTMGEYKKFGGVLLPTKTTQEIGPIQQVLTITEVSYDKIEDKIFELPPQIKALVK